jgi:hypothetical protein
VKIQVLTALISYLLVALYKQRHASTMSLWECLVLIRATLFQRPATQASLYRKRRRDAELIALRQPSLI